MTTITRLSELTGIYVLDTVHTRIGFVGRHTMATKVRGRFEEFEGSAFLDGGDPSRSSIQLTIQARSLQTGNVQRDEHLRAKFLDLDNHATIAFTSSRVDQVDETRFTITGDLAIRGVTKPVTVDFELTSAENGPAGELRVGFEGGVTIDRKDWHVNWNAATAVLIGQKVALEFEVTAIRRS
ncbi:YceI family protein [Nonomuraea diastatica]|uniref:Polyisoprenoid-binding protein n=1 Tax=Nonomuraea diastatica TaxID=1848329 RepID=A0A4R4WRQ0_9ACTN|nr:YceI family protein [Nonomuraea diastatica]TDD18710.1 polyisoprenoid-binding protein [Nonomuraea diastatica]